MENAVDALKLAAAVLIFIIAIATSFSVFGTAKQTADQIITMRDKQAYLQEAELDGGILYTSSDSIQDEDGDGAEEAGVTISGDRIVEFDDIVSTIYRYAKEKFAVTIVKDDGEVIVRYDSNTEDIMRQYNNIKAGGLDEFIEQLEENTRTSYAEPKFSDGKLEEIYEIDVRGNTGIKCGAPWYGNDAEVQKRINADIIGEEYENNGQKYIGKELTKYIRKTIVEVTNEIDKSKYIEDAEGQNTGLLQTYNMPAIEIVYIILD